MKFGVKFLTNEEKVLLKTKFVENFLNLLIIIRITLIDIKRANLHNILERIG